VTPRAHREGARGWSSASTPGPVREFHATLPGYRPTPLVGLPHRSARAGVAQVWVKDEADRFGLPAFKILGASWAVDRVLSARAGHGEPAGSFDLLRRRTAGSAVTLVTATDGNHGRAVARMARLLDVRARIAVPAGVGAATVDAIAAEGAEVVRTDLVSRGAGQHRGHRRQPGPLRRRGRVLMIPGRPGREVVALAATCSSVSTVPAPTPPGPAERATRGTTAMGRAPARGNDRSTALRRQLADQPVQRVGVIATSGPAGRLARYGGYFAASVSSARSRSGPASCVAACPSIRIHHSAAQSAS
jgi:hypothetical protein